jgi:hypothetical protein
METLIFAAIIAIKGAQIIVPFLAVVFIIWNILE